MPLEALPTELQCSIIRLLDPIGLISISQTNKRFRQLINPKKKHFAERLLALEGLDQYGGCSPILRSRDQWLSPYWTSPKWEKIRWACTDCLRLLPHAHFDSHSLLRLRYRKPIPGSPASRLISTWEPADRTSRLNLDKKKRNTEEAAQSERTLRQRYLFCVTATSPIGNPKLLQEYGIGAFPNMSLDEINQMDEDDVLQIIDHEARSIELERCGDRRRFRRCHECRYSRGEMRSHTRPMGIPIFPIVACRTYLFTTGIDRWFPGFTEYLECKRPTFNMSAPLASVISYDSLWAHSWPMYMARCPGCTRWKELRDFRFGGASHHFKPCTNLRELGITWDGREVTDELLSGSRCNSCFEMANGRQELIRVLQHWILRLIDIQLCYLAWRFRSDFGTLARMGPKDLPNKQRLEIKHMMRHTACMHKGDDYLLTYADVALLKLRRDQWNDMWEQMKRNGEVDSKLSHVDGWCDCWTRELNDWEFQWQWWMMCKEELTHDPDVLGEWAFDRQGKALILSDGAWTDKD